MTEKMNNSRNHVGSGLRWAEAIAKEQMAANAAERAANKPVEASASSADMDQCDGCHQGASLSQPNDLVDGNCETHVTSLERRYAAP